MALQPLIPAEQNNEASWYTSGLAGIVSGGIKVVEGAFSLGAELVDLGLDTNTAAQVEIFFDKIKSTRRNSRTNMVLVNLHKL